MPVQLVDDAPNGFRIEQAVGWYPYAGAILLLALPVMVVAIVWAAGAFGTHRELLCQREAGGTGTVTITESAPFTAPRQWQTSLARVAKAQFTQGTRTTLRYGTITFWTLVLAMREGAPWSVMTLFDAETKTRWEAELDEFFEGDGPTMLMLREPHLIGTLPDGWAVALLGTLIGAAAALGVFRATAESARVVVDARRQELRLTRWRHFRTETRTLPFETIAHVAPFDPTRVKDADTFMLSLECRDGDLIDLGRFDVEKGREPEESHARVADRLARAIGLTNLAGMARPR